MTEFVAELYVPRSADGLDRHAEGARLAAEQMTRDGTRVTYLRSIFVPEDETCFHLYTAASAAEVDAAARRAALGFDRIAEAISESRGEMR
jgi:Protein of unknown function (DUF4242)